MDFTFSAAELEYRDRARAWIRANAPSWWQSQEGDEFESEDEQFEAIRRWHQQLYDAVLKRLKETGLTGGLETNNVTVLEEAKLPGGPVRPDPRRNLLVSIAVGLALGLGLALGIEYFDTRVNTPDDVERYFGLPVVGVVPGFEKG